MKAVVKTCEEKGFSYMEVQTPEPGPGEVLIRVETAAICGTDIHYYHWNKTARDFGGKYGIQFPFIAGHECAGTIVAVGSGVKDRKVGERVSIETHISCGVCYQCQNNMAHNCANMQVYGTSCNGCFADYAVVDERVAFVLPDEISFEEGALLEPGGVAMHAVEEAEIHPGEVAVVNGCGPLGLMAVQILRACGAARIIAVDLDPYRLKLAEKLGALTVNAAREDVGAFIAGLTADRGGADVVLEFSGAAAAYKNLFDYIRLEGRLVTVGHPAEDISLSITRSVNLKGIRIKGVFGRRIWNTWWNLASLIKAKKITPLEVVTHRFSFARFQEAFEQVDKGAGKILFLKD